MEGLEQLEWNQIERHLNQTESRIISEFGLQANTISRKLVLSVVGILTGALIATWYFSSNPETVDMSPPELSTATSPLPENELDQVPEVDEVPGDPESNAPIADSVISIESSEITPEPVESKVSKPKPAPANTGSDENIETHIAVGRVVDVKGLAIVNATVHSGDISDTTDSYGYFALRVPKGGTKVIVTHLATDYQLEIDTNQNWEIVLDVAKQKVYDYSPMNAANRFK